MKKLFFMIVTLSISPTLFAAAKNVKTENGRFQLIQLSDFRRDQYLLDTQTGTMWLKICIKPGKETGDCALHVWEKDAIEDITISREAIKSLYASENKGE